MEENKLPTVQEFYENISLYTKYPVTKTDINEVFDLIFTLNTIDCYCIKCGSHSVFKPEDNRPEQRQGMSNSTFIVAKGNRWNADIGSDTINVFKRFYCSRDNNHRLMFDLLIVDSELQKIGQHPSIADISSHDIKRFKNILGSQYFAEYNRAIGLFSHGVGVGSFVYLRRIIENFIISPAYEKALGSANFDKGVYEKSRVREKVTILKDYLPQFLVENSILYSVISKGIHELTEEECNEYFPILKGCLDFVLTELVEKHEVELQRQALAQKLGQLKK